MKTSLPHIIVLMLLIPLWAAGQKNQGVQGSVSDAESGQAMGYVTIAAVDSKGRQTGTAISQISGKYFLHLPRSGKYTLYFSFVGYGTESRTVDFRGTTLDLGNQRLKPGIAIEEIFVAARPLIRRESDRIVFDVGKDPEIGKFKMMEIMSKIPELEMSPGSGNLNFQGQPLEKILIDGRHNDIIHHSRQYPMEFIRADYMAQIEVILPGSPEYHNEKPILNIKLDRPLPYGIAGEIRPDASSDKAFGIKSDLVANTPITGIGVNYQFLFSDAPKLENRSTRENFLPESNDRLLESRSESSHMTRSHNLNVSLFRPLFRNTGNIRLQGSTQRAETIAGKTNTSESYDAEGNRTSGNSTSSRMYGQQPMKFNGGVGLDKFWKTYTRRFNLKFGYDYTDRPTENRTTTRIEPSPETVSEQQSRSRSGSVQHALKGTFSFINGTSITASSRNRMLYLSTGYVNRRYENTSQYYLLDDLSGEYIEEETRFNGLNYRQEFAYCYLGYSDNLFNNRLSYSLRLHGEYLANEGTYQSRESIPLDYHEFNLLPQIRLAYEIKRANFRLGYSASVQRPNLMQMSPYVDDTDPDNLSAGNPELKGQYMHAAFFNYSQRIDRFPLKMLALRYYFRSTNNAIERTTTVDGNNVSFTTYENLGRSRQSDISFIISTREFYKKISAYFSIQYSHDYYRFHDGAENRNNRLSGSASLYFHPAKGMQINASYNIRPTSRSAQRQSDDRYSSLNVSLSKYFPKAHLGGSIEVEDLLNGHRFLRETLGSTTFFQTSYREQLGRIFRFSLYWRFGKFKQEAKQQHIDSGVYDMGTRE